jgi:hypothetical protein
MEWGAWDLYAETIGPVGDHNRGGGIVFDLRARVVLRLPTGLYDG